MDLLTAVLLLVPRTAFVTAAVAATLCDVGLFLSVRARRDYYWDGALFLLAGATAVVSFRPGGGEVDEMKGVVEGEEKTKTR